MPRQTLYTRNRFGRFSRVRPERRSVLNGGACVTSEIARLELHATLQRKEAAREIQMGGGRRALACYDADVENGLILVKAIDTEVRRRFDDLIEGCYGRTPPVSLRTLDGIHIATASVAVESMVVATDRRLRDAAASLGFAVYPPKQ